jgi:hypothetical protein
MNANNENNFNNIINNNDDDELMQKDCRNAKIDFNISQHVFNEKVFGNVSIIKRLFIEQCSINKIGIAANPQVFDCGGEYVLMYLNQAKIFRVHRKKFMEKTNERNKEYTTKVVCRDGIKCLVFKPRFRKQVLGFETMKNVMDSVVNMLTTARSAWNGLRDYRFRLLVVDMLALILEIRDGFVTPSKVLVLMLRLYSAYHRYQELVQIHATFKAESLDAADLILGYATLGLPARLIEAMKTVAVLTGKKTLSSEVMIETMLKVVELLSGVIDFFSKLAGDFLPKSLADFMIGMFDYLGHGLRNYRLIKQVAEKYTFFLRNEQAIFDPSFRQDVMSLRKKCIESDGFMEYVSNASNRYFKTTWDNFEQNVCKGVKIFDESRRDEPICFVFEGPAGSGKSALMNNFVDLLREDGLSVYTHSVPSAEDAKDFYDDYENQDVFVMDDVGQQGKSQWRYIINFVAPTKYPLPCAQANKKNTKSFTSKIIVCTTNHLRDLNSFTSTDCISEPDALRRRIHLIEVNSYDEHGFAQRMKYYKYDHKHPEPTWKNEFLYHNSDIDVEPECDTGVVAPLARVHHGLTWLYTMFMEIRDREDRERTACTMDTKSYKDIIGQYKNRKGNKEVFHDAFASESFSSVFSFGMKSCHNGVAIASEWCAFYGQQIIDLMAAFVGTLSASVLGFLTQDKSTITVNSADLPHFLRKFIPSGKLELSLIHLLLVVGALGALMTCFKIKQAYDNYQDRINENMKRDMEAARKRVAEVFKDFPERIKNKYKPQGTRLTSVSKFVKLVEIVEGENTVITHGVVSGNKILLPFHTDVAVGARVNLYQSLVHYENGHIEAEKVRLTRPRAFPTVDLVVWDMDGVVPLYKICRNLFISEDYKDNDMTIVNSMGSVDVKMFLTIKPNMEPVSYEGYVVKRSKQKTEDNPNGIEKQAATISHEPWSGIISPLSGDGMCGSILASETGGIVAFHVAGDGEVGFMVKPQGKVRELIRDAMINNSRESNFEIDDEVLPGFSGVRMRYEEGQIKTLQVNTETNLEKTAFHVDFNQDTTDLINGLKTSGVQLYTKSPPNFHALGAQKKLMDKIAKKTFSHQGEVTPQELNFIEQYIDTLIPAYSHVSDEDAAFGNDFIGPLNKDSSNGYGWERDKNVYFDFENKKITDKGKEMISRFEWDGEYGEYFTENFLCRETFKDELRKDTKVDEPRTFRVMPLPHIFWTKKLCARLIPHFKSQLHITGCGIGLNPYLDFAKIYERLRQCHITGDIDFAKWDGSVVEAIMHTISNVLERKYRGKHVMQLDYVLKTMRRSFVLVGDAVYATTHGLPSGTWLTLLMNCLINKSLTALTVFRNKDDATVSDVNEIVDYVVGDDKIFGVPKHLAHVFNLKTMAKVASDLGMTCTNGDKTPITTESQPLEKLNFVKRNFYYHVDLKRIVGALDLSTLVNTLQWMDGTKDRTEVMEGKMRSVQVEAYLHGRGIYTMFMKLLTKHDYTNALFSEQKVREILAHPQGYEEIMIGLGKDLSFLRQ